MASEEPAAEAAAAAEPAAAETSEAMPVDAKLVDWLSGRVPELERLSTAKLEVPKADAAGEDGKVQVRIVGKPVAVARAKVLLEDQLRSAPGAEAGAADGPAAAEEAKLLITLAGRTFPDRDALVAHVKALQSNAQDGVLLSPEDSFFLFHLATHHPHFTAKMSAPVVGFKYQSHEAFKGTKCFFVVRADGTEEGISVMKCVEAVQPKLQQPRGEGLEARGTKRGREGDDKPKEEAAEDEAPPAKRPQREIQKGCVVDIQGVPSDLPYYELRDLLSEHGDIRFVELIRPEKVKKDDDAMDADGEEKKEEGEEKKEEGEEKKEEGEEKKEEGEEKKEEGEEKKEEGENEEKEEAEEKPTFVSARVRCNSAEDAAKVAAEFKGPWGEAAAPVCRVLEGDEERTFWERLWEKADAKGGKDGKGKGKGKDKGKGKGKKGKGKGKKGKW